MNQEATARIIPAAGRGYFTRNAVRSDRRRAETLIRSLVKPTMKVSPDTKVNTVKEMIEDQPPLCSVVIAEGERPAGLLMSYHLDRKLGTQYGVSLFYRRNISLLMDAEPLIAAADQPIGEVAAAAMNREPGKIYDDIIVMSESEILGTVSVQDMMETLGKVEIRARKDAEAATHAKSQFLAQMSHDIRTPMNAILGMAELLSETRLTQEQRSFVNVFKNAGESLLALINDILDLSRVEAGRIQLESVPFDLTDIMESTCEVMALKVHEKNVELVCHKEPSVPNRLIGDPNRLRQVFSNLLGNALKFTREGEIVFSAAMDHSGHPEESGNVRIRFSVTDSGIGIPKDRQKHIFDSFVQADASTSREYGGTGLGLAICKRITELMRGSISVVSEPGEGSTFSFTGNFAADLSADPDELPFDLKGIRILLVDDHGIARDCLAERLVGWGAMVASASDGMNAMAQLERANGNIPFDLFLVDTRMPGMDGYETAAEIRTRCGNLSRVILMSPSNEIVQAVDRGRSLGVGAVLVRPVREGELLRTIGALLGKQPLENDFTKTLACPVEPQSGEMIPLKILLAEDNENNRTLFSFYLKETPHEVHMAEDGAICLEKYRTETYNIIFMDVDMPVMDGYQATREIRNWEAENGLPAVPIIALTAHALDGKRQESLDAGCTDHLTKPFKKAQIFNILRKYESRVRDILQVVDEERAGIDFDPDLMELIPGFVWETFEEMKLLEDAIAEGDHEKIRRMGHRIKGSALCYGFEEMGRIAEEIEMAGEEKEDLKEIQNEADLLRSYLERIREELFESPR